MASVELRGAGGKRRPLVKGSIFLPTYCTACVRKGDVLCLPPTAACHVILRPSDSLPIWGQMLAEQIPLGQKGPSTMLLPVSKAPRSLAP